MSCRPCTYRYCGAFCYWVAVDNLTIFGHGAKKAGSDGRRSAETFVDAGIQVLHPHRLIVVDFCLRGELATDLVDELVIGLSILEKAGCEAAKRIRRGLASSQDEQGAIGDDLFFPEVEFVLLF